jgi:hypothetical protein
MRLLYAIGVTLVLWGCATDEQGRLISRDEVSWIQKGMTTRSQVIERFGSPRFETPLQSSTHSTTTTTTATADGQSQTTTTTVHVDEPPKGTKAIYPYTRSRSTLPFDIKVRTSQFWLVYDENGVVQDYGFVGDVPVTATAKPN